MKSKLKPFLLQHPGLEYQLLWIPYLVLFFLLDNVVKQPKYIIHCPLDDVIPFCEWFVFPYCSWFFLLAGVTAYLWLHDTAAYKRLVVMMFSGMFFCLAVYVVLPNGLNLRPEVLPRQNIAVFLMQLLWKADAAVNVCPSIHCQTSAAMALAFSKSGCAKGRRGLQAGAWLWAGLICLSTMFTKQHSAVDVALGLLLVLPWYFVLYRRKK